MKDDANVRPTIFGDFNARTIDDCVRLSTRGSRESLIATGVKAGAVVWLSDGEVRALALVEDRRRDLGCLVARVDWATVVQLEKPVAPFVYRDLTPEEIEMLRREGREFQAAYPALRAQADMPRGNATSPPPETDNEAETLIPMRRR